MKHPAHYLPIGKLRYAMIPSLVLAAVMVASLPSIMPLAMALVWLCSLLPFTNVIENIMLRSAFLGEVTDPWPMLASFHHYLSGVALFASFVIMILAGLFPHTPRLPN